MLLLSMKEFIKPDYGMANFFMILILSYCEQIFTSTRFPLSSGKIKSYSTQTSLNSQNLNSALKITVTQNSFIIMLRMIHAQAKNLKQNHSQMKEIQKNVESKKHYARDAN